MVGMLVSCGARIRYICLVHLIGADLIGGIEEGGESSFLCYHGAVNLF
jgi:hypothetical protein